MQKITQTRWFHMTVGIILIVLGIGGLVAGIIGNMSDNLRYIIGGIFMALVGIGYISPGRKTMTAKAEAPKVPIKQ